MLNWCHDQDECLFLNKTLCYVSKAVAFTSGTSLIEQPTDNEPLHHYCLNNAVILRECKAALFGCRNILGPRNTVVAICYVKRTFFLKTNILGIFLFSDSILLIGCFLSRFNTYIIPFCLLLSNNPNNLGDRQAWLD